MSSKENELLNAALKYAKAGYGIIPVAGKRPVTPNGKDDASTSEAVIKAWWTGNPTAGIGLVIPKEHVVVDIDNKLAIQRLEAFGFNLPATAKALSRRGYHFWYRINPTDVVSRKIGVFPGVDILVNGYVVAPPSPTTAGGFYSWEVPLEDGISEAPEWLETLVTEHSIEHSRVSPEEVLSGVPTGKIQTTLFRYACSLKKRKASRAEAKVLLVEAAKASDDRAEFFTPAYTDKLVDRVWKTYEDNQIDEPEKQYKVQSLADLAAKPLDPSVPIVKDLLPSTGYTVFTSPPKSGKSALAAYVCACIATGNKVWGIYDVRHSGVLYLDLEQEETAGFLRWKGILSSLNVFDMPSNLFVANDWPKMDDGGIEKLQEFLVDHPNVYVVVIDTLADFWPEEIEGSGNAYHKEQRVVRIIQKLARDYGCAVLLVHHDAKNKQSGSGMIGRASGTYAITGKAHGVWHLDSDDQLTSGIFKTTGKNMPPSKLLLGFDKEHMRWRL